MAPTPDTVRLSELKTEFLSDPHLTKHSYHVSKPGKRKVLQEEVWQRQRELGRGAFGAVYLERCVQGEKTGNVRAVKKIQKVTESNYDRELEAIALFSHRKYEQCFVTSYGWYTGNDHIFITMQYLPNGDLHQYLSEPLPENEAQQISYQMLEGLSFMHEYGFAHRDLKPANILVVDRGPSWWIKIADFGISKRLTEGMTSLRTVTGTPAFTAPEVLGYGDIDDDTYASYTNAVDIWAVGVIAFLILTGETLFRDRRRLASYANQKMEFPIDTLDRLSIGEDAINFVRISMAPKPQHRPNAKESLDHPWFQEMSDVDSSEVNWPLVQDAQIGATRSLSRDLPAPSYPEHLDRASRLPMELVTEASAAWSTQEHVSSILARPRQATEISSRLSAQQMPSDNVSSDVVTAIRDVPQPRPPSLEWALSDVREVPSSTASPAVVSVARHGAQPSLETVPSGPHQELRLLSEHAYKTSESETELVDKMKSLIKPYQSGSSSTTPSSFQTLRPSPVPPLPRKPLARIVPDMVVGIDIGLTSSAVAWSMGPEWPEPRPIYRWPGKSDHELSRRVDTCVSSNVSTGEPVTWGFLSDAEDERYEYNALFLLNMNPDYRDPIVVGAPTYQEAQMWYQQYLTFLYRYLIQYFSDTMPRFNAKTVEFVFSVPMSWKKNPSFLAEMEQVMQRVFGQRERDSASAYLTESEATAIYASQGALEKDTTILVCNAAGGTTDVTVLSVESSGPRTQLTPLCWTEGEAIGSILIDWRIRTIIKERVNAIRHLVEENDMDLLVSRMMSHTFATYKSSFGARGMDLPKFFLPIPGLKPGHHEKTAGIDDSRVVITREEFQEIVDDQVDKLCNVIDKQCSEMKLRYGSLVKGIDYVALAGELGSIPYVQRRIKDRYEVASSNRGLGARQVQVLICGEPQLAVVNGLVTCRMQTLDRFAPSYSRCPVSFGVVCREVYNPSQHQGEIVVLDPIDGQRWVKGQIHWIIQQGDVIDLASPTPLTAEYYVQLKPGEERMPWTTQIVTYSALRLPSNVRKANVKEVYKIVTVLTPGDMKRKNRHWYNLGKEYNRAEIKLHIIASRSGIRFEIWSRDGPRSQHCEEIEVDWQAADEAATHLSDNLTVWTETPRWIDYTEVQDEEYQ